MLKQCTAEANVCCLPLSTGTTGVEASVRFLPEIVVLNQLSLHMGGDVHVTTTHNAMNI